MAFSSLFSIVIFTLFTCLCFCPSISSNIEGNALISFSKRVSVSDPKTNVFQNWHASLVNPCNWFHVTCDHNNNVISLELGNANIYGTIGPELAKLKHLKYLELYKNNLNGTIPEELGELEKLVSLDLYGNKLEGPIPKSLSNLKALKFLRLNDNKLTGPIPRELIDLTRLAVFDVSNNDLCGTIPVDGPFQHFPVKSFDNNTLNGPELKGLVPYDFGC